MEEEGDRDVSVPTARNGERSPVHTTRGRIDGLIQSSRRSSTSIAR